MPTSRPHTLLNTPDIELWPAWLLRARGNHDARALSQAQWLLRRKRDGKYLAAYSARGLLPLQPRWMRGVDAYAALDAAAVPAHSHAFDETTLLPLDDLQERLDLLGLDADDYEARTGLELMAEPAALALAGFDRYRRPLWLTKDTGRAWLKMRAFAATQGIALDAISGYRSHDYQLGIFERKLARGQTVAQILTVNAAPGYSEHHTGRALDIGTPGEPPAEESFERTTAFAWLTKNAADFGFRMSYPKDNPNGIVYEPWHWFFIG